MSVSQAALLLTVWGFILSQEISGQTEGTYRFVICEEGCASTDTARALAKAKNLEPEIPC